MRYRCVQPDCDDGILLSPCAPAEMLLLPAGTVVPVEEQDILPGISVFNQEIFLYFGPDSLSVFLPAIILPPHVPVQEEPQAEMLQEEKGGASP